MRRWPAIALLLSIATPVVGQPSLDELMEQVRRERRELGTASRSVAAATDRRALQQQLAEVQAALAEATRQSEQLNRQHEAGRRELERMSATVRTETAGMAELFGVVRQYAGDMAGALKSSLVSAQYGTRNALPARLAASDHIPAPEELHDFYVLMLEEMVQSGKVARFGAEVVNAAGVPETRDVVRVGTFNLVADDSFLRYEVNNGTIQELARQPARRYRRNAQTLTGAVAGFAPMALDPTGGQLLSLLIQTPGVAERVKQGGTVGYVIIALGFLGLAIGIYRLLYLGAAGAGIRNQLKSGAALETNALGRILSVYNDNADVSTETLELKLDEAIIRETPVLEKWQMALKVIAAVAPLLGLLGTVVGMIETFQQIALFGTSDPRLMADGISKALVTTMLGLLVAVPVVLLHSMVASRSKHLIEILEEQSAAIIAEQAERKR